MEAEVEGERERTSPGARQLLPDPTQRLHTDHSPRPLASFSSSSSSSLSTLCISTSYRPISLSLFAFSSERGAISLSFRRASRPRAGEQRGRDEWAKKAKGRRLSSSDRPEQSDSRKEGCVGQLTDPVKQLVHLTNFLAAATRCPVVGGGGGGAGDGRAGRGDKVTSRMGLLELARATAGVGFYCVGLLRYSDSGASAVTSFSVVAVIDGRTALS